MRFSGLPWWLSGKEPAYQCRRCGFDSWLRKIPWRRKCQTIPVSLLGKSHGQRSLAGYNPWDCKESDRPQRLSMQAHEVLRKSFILKSDETKSKNFYSTIASKLGRMHPVLQENQVRMIKDASSLKQLILSIFFI